MSKYSNQSEAKSLETYKISLFNALHQSTIATQMSALGYGAEKIAEGKALLDTTIQKYEENKTEDVESSAAYENFLKAKEKLWEIYKMDRKKAKVVFRTEAVTLEKLMIDKAPPKSHAKWLEAVRTFYTNLSLDEAMKTKVATLLLDAEGIENGLVQVDEVEMLRALYLKEKGESQGATEKKDIAFAELDDWMSNFYAVAKIALDDTPQLLESLGKVVPN